MARLTSLLVCDHAQVRDGLLMVLSGGITRILVPAIPATVHFTVAVVVEIPFFELDQPHEVRISVVDPESAAPIAEPFVATHPADANAAERMYPGEPALVPMAVGVTLGVERAGQFDVRVNVDDHVAELQSIWVVEAPQLG
jgi:hypothetical protein